MSKRDRTLDAASAKLRAALDGFRVTSGLGFDLDAFRSDDLPEGMPQKKDASRILKAQKKKLASLQELLYANGTWSLLAIFQALDAAGKDSTIKHVASGINPQGVSVASFKAPGPEDLAHDFLWRISRALPARGMIGLFNRSHYEEVLVARVHEEILKKQALPRDLAGKENLWSARIADIANFEAYLGRQGTHIVKFFLNVGRDEQKRRFLDRLDRPEKTWKFDPLDLRERDLWPKYRSAYQDAIGGTATGKAPWYIIPADRKWFTHLLVAEALLEVLEGLDLEQPRIAASARPDLEDARRQLMES